MLTQKMSSSDNNIHIPITLDKPPQFVGPSVENGQPISYPLKTLQQLQDWKPNDPSDHGQMFSVAEVPYVPKIASKDAPKTLVCNDDSGGYLADRFVQGTDGSPFKNCFHIDYLNMVDVFVYFSHTFIVVPPVGWINACHRNGVAVLGTFITEGGEGQERCKEIFSSEAKWKNVADQMVALARFYRFEGWFINIENQIDLDKIESLKNFLDYLTKQIHELNANGLVIWYDSVINNGTVAYQNELNDLNKMFYDVTDGIFLNYWWDPQKLQSSKCVARSPGSVYAGIDIFGRDTYGGGKFDTNVALKVIFEVGLSSALFAPVWSVQEFDADVYIQKTKLFWQLIKPYCRSYPLSTKSGFGSQFNPGCCNIVSDPTCPWFLLNAQDTLPLLPSNDFSILTDKSYVTGMLKVTPQSNNEKICLFKVQMTLDAGVVCSLLCRAIGDFTFVLLTTIGVLYPINKKSGVKGAENFDILYFKPNQFCTVEGLAVQSTTQEAITVCSFELFPYSISGDEFDTKSFSMNCIEVDWAKNATGLNVGLTLVFEQLPAGRESTLVYWKASTPTGKEGEYVKLGASHCQRFRVHGLEVADPVIPGQIFGLVFKCCHFTSGGIGIGESLLFVTYSY